MGLRSWYTPVYTYETFKKVVKSIKKNPYAYGIHFILKLNKDASPFKAKGLLIAWSGDGSSSLEHLKPLESRAETCLLDNLSSKFIKNPPSLGIMFESEKDIKPELFSESNTPIKKQVSLKITIKYYPCTFSFTVLRDFKPFSYEDQDGRSELLLQKMYEMKIHSPSHAYEDYVIENVRKVRGGEHWHLGS